MIQPTSRTVLAVSLQLFFVAVVQGGSLSAGAAKVDITNREGPVADPLHARALVVRDESTTAVIVTLDVVSIGEIGHIKNDYLGKVRAALQNDLGIDPKSVIINASHCHGVPCADVAERTVQAVKDSWKKLEPVHVGVGVGHEDRIQENRRLKLKSGREADVRHAYSLPPDEEVAGIGPVDPQIGVLRLDRKSGETLAVVYTFAMHPILSVPSGGNSADVTGFSSKVIEDNLSDGTISLFVQGCGGDINPATYKDVNNPRHAEPLGNRLGLSTLAAVRKIKTKDDSRLKLINETIDLPRADLAARIETQLAEQQRLLKTLAGTSLNWKTFLPLAVKYKINGEFPSYYSHRYLREKEVGRNELERLDSENRRNLEAYIKNIYAMEELTRIQINIDLLKKHHAQNIAAGKRTVDVELVGLRIGDFVLTTFPGELTVQIGLNIKQKAPHKFSFVAGYTNGYIYYCPTAEQLKNVGYAQEDSDCILSPEWQSKYEDKAAEILKRL